MKHPLPPSMIPVLQGLEATWHKSAEDERQIEAVLRETPDPTFSGGAIDPNREEMIRVHGIVRAHRRFTRQCIDYISWGESVEKLPMPQDKAKAEGAENARKAAEAFGSAIETAADDCITALYNLAYGMDVAEDGGRDVTEENIRAIARNLRYALDSAKVRAAKVGGRR